MHAYCVDGEVDGRRRRRRRRPRDRCSSASAEQSCSESAARRLHDTSQKVHLSAEISDPSGCCSTSSSSWPRSRARRERSARSPTASTAELRALGLEVDEDDAGAGDRLDVGNLLCRLPGRLDGGTPIFLCAHLDTVPPQGAARARRRRGRHRPERRRDDPRRGQQVGRRRDDRGGAADRRGGQAARRRRAAVHAEGGGRPDRRRRLRHHEARGRARLRLRPGGPDRRRDHGCALPALDCSSASTAGRRTRGWSRRRAAPRSRPPRARSPICASAGSTTRRPRTSALITRRQRAQHHPRVVRARGGGALARRAQARRSRPGDARHVRVRGELAECTLETEVSETYQGYRFKDERPDRPARGDRTRALWLRVRPDAHRRRRRCERLQHQGSALPEPGERDGGDPHRRRAHRRRTISTRWST